MKGIKAELHDEADRLKAENLELREQYASLEQAREKVLAENEALRRKLRDICEMAEHVRQTLIDEARVPHLGVFERFA